MVLIITTVAVAVFNLTQKCDAFSPSGTNETAIYTACVNDQERQSSSFINHIVVTSWWLMLTLATTPSRRGQYLSFLGRMMIGEFAQSATTIASMLPHAKSPEKTIEMAKKKFRAIPYTSLELDDFNSNEDFRGLQDMTVEARL